MSGRRDVATGVTSGVARLQSGVMPRSETTAEHLAGEESIDDEASDTADERDPTSRSEAPTLPPPARLANGPEDLRQSRDRATDAPPAPERRLSGIFGARRDSVVADLRRDPRSEK
jgi:uncharacterized membrane protein